MIRIDIIDSQDQTPPLRTFDMTDLDSLIVAAIYQYMNF